MRCLRSSAGTTPIDRAAWPRCDHGHGRTLPKETRALLCQSCRENPAASATLILRTLVADGRIAKDAVSPVTVRRLFHERGLDRQTPGATHHTQRLRWQAERPNALWHADVCHGAAPAPGRWPHPAGAHPRTLLDDARCSILANETFSSEQDACMLQLLVRGRRGRRGNVAGRLTYEGVPSGMP